MNNKAIRFIDIRYNELFTIPDVGFELRAVFIRVTKKAQPRGGLSPILLLQGMSHIINTPF